MKVRVVEDSGKEVPSVISKMSVAMTATMCYSLMMILYIQISNARAMGPGLCSGLGKHWYSYQRVIFEAKE